MSVQSYHIFYFPFKWCLPDEKDKSFSEQVDLTHIPVEPYSMWERVRIDEKETSASREDRNGKELEELFGERQYYFDFVHPVLYDMKGEESPLINHYERREPKEGKVEYRIKVKDREYVLRVDAINLNLYSTGVGILSFFLANEREEQMDESSVRDINQFGRHIMPPHSGEFEPHNRNMLAESITITGLHGGDDGRYMDPFNYIAKVYHNESEGVFGLADVWKPARFVDHLIKDLSSVLRVTPVIDDRMLVNCWYGNDELASQVKAMTGEVKDDEFAMGNFWYKYVFVDNGDFETCQNQEMKKELLKKSTYSRWQKSGTLYGISRYSLVALTDRDWFATHVLSMHMRTIYSRMFELIIIQRASMLRFSGEVTKVSALSGHRDRVVAQRIGSLYKEYIRFVNQIYFRNVTVQDQGVELYNRLMEQFASSDQIKDLDDEIGELHQYITLLIEQKRNDNGEWLNWLAAVFLPATVLTGLFGMNRLEELAMCGDFWAHLLIIVLISTLVYYFIKRRRL